MAEPEKPFVNGEDNGELLRVSSWPEKPWLLTSNEFASDRPTKPDKIAEIWQNVRSYSESAQAIFSAIKLLEYTAVLNDSRIEEDESLAKYVSTSLLASTAAVRQFNQAQRRAIQRVTPKMEMAVSPFMQSLSAVLDAAKELYPNTDSNLRPLDQEAWQQLRTSCYSIARHIYLREDGLSDAEILARVEVEVEAEARKKAEAEAEQ